jgi:hypothetical protein
VSKAHEELLVKRARLVARAARERDQVADFFEAWRGPLAVVDGVVMFMRGLRRHARLIGVGATVAGAALAIARPVSIGRWLSGGHVVWRLARALLSGRRG